MGTVADTCRGSGDLQDHSVSLSVWTSWWKRVVQVFRVSLGVTCAVLQEAPADGVIQSDLDTCRLLAP